MPTEEANREHRCKHTLKAATEGSGAAPRRRRGILEGHLRGREPHCREAAQAWKREEPPLLRFGGFVV